MAFTNIELVKKHLLEHHLGAEEIENEPLHLVSGKNTRLRMGNLLPASEKVKAKEMNEPVLYEGNFSLLEEISLPDQELVYDSVVVADNSSMNTLHQQNVDYTVDYDNGIIKRIATGCIPAGATVAIWYLYYHIYTRGTDYKVNYTTAEITRLPEGALEEGQWVLVDYSVEYGFLNDDIIANAITEAADKVAKYIDEQYSESTDQGLVTAETYLAVAILCRVKAGETASASPQSSTARALAESWTVLANSYQMEAYRLLNRFVRKIGYLRSPEVPQ
jgi:hypothetical protein